MVDRQRRQCPPRTALAHSCASLRLLHPPPELVAARPAIDAYGPPGASLTACMEKLLVAKLLSVQSPAIAEP